MRAQDFLEELYVLNTKISAKRAELEILDSMLFNMTQQLKADTVQTSKEQDPLGSAMARICDMKEEIKELINQWIIRFDEITEVIQQVEDIKQYELLHMRYIQNFKWIDIAEVWDVSYQWVTDVRKEAYESVQKILDK